MADHPCAHCGQTFDHRPGHLAHFPFCSRRCRYLDLSRWMNGEFMVSRPMSEDDAAQLAIFPDELVPPEG